jgi:hypothetical protein
MTKTILTQSYPKLFKHLQPNEIACKDGWIYLIDKLSAIIENEINYLPKDIQTEIYVVQIKQKLGGLRFYMNQYTDTITGAINLAEHMSYSICEICGKCSASPKSIRHYITTLCDEHYESEFKKII